MKRQRALLEELPALEFPEESLKDWDKASAARERQREREAITSRLTVTTRLTTPFEHVSGPFDEMAEEFDFRTYTGVDMLLGPEYASGDKIILSIQPRAALKEWRDPQVQLRVESGDPGWTKQAVAQLSDEVDLGRPRWGCLFTRWGRNFFNTVVCAAIFIPGVNLLQTTTSLPSAAILAIWGVAIFAISWVIVWFNFPLKQLLPPVEILPDGASPKGARALAFLFGVVVVPTILALIIPRLIG